MKANQRFKKIAICERLRLWIQFAHRKRVSERLLYFIFILRLDPNENRVEIACLQGPLG